MRDGTDTSSSGGSDVDAGGCDIPARRCHLPGDKTIDELEEQHVVGKARIRNIKHALTRYELAGVSEFPVLREMLEEYADFSANHRRLKRRRFCLLLIHG
jgi:hypothetical protein